jgi:hypothetical protein
MKKTKNELTFKKYKMVTIKCEYWKNVEKTMNFIEENIKNYSNYVQSIQN